MSHTLTDCQRLEAWYESQTEETLRDLFDRFGAVSPRECWHAFFNDCPPPAHQGSSDSLAAPVEVGQGVCIPKTLEQFQRWLETEAHTAHQRYSHGCLTSPHRIANLRAAMALLLDFKDQA